MQIAIITAAAAFAGALIALLVYHLAVVVPARSRVDAVLAVHEELLGGGTGRAATQRLAAVETALAELARRTERAEAGLGELVALSRTDVSNIGFVRYDAFDDTGSELSYALALLNREGDGAVVSSIYSRTDTRTFGKAVERFKPVVPASAEELAAIAKARGTGTAS